ncbi:hypothetical protein [Sulfurimonas autotrophica]|uniref:STAS domain-containing protein n=1 Tax=Sulfurimonas autotrophica (strain ATCC BAA-671 / DSM 16294 / JCM 11897 / OK10) TaxID=563040 RepID=E0UTL9_SULAO|nr:hypothetical protein [Sulfurimonas autotrophica]ADN08250.1 conserved hypothetical protein [Sulfurimonas autotrophica DSM 16294]
MDISVSSNTITLNGNIKSIGDYQQIKEIMDDLIKTNKHVIFNIKDSISITSSVIGYFNKLILKDNVDLQINVGDEQLMELFEDLSLVSLFKVKKV